MTYIGRITAITIFGYKSIEDAQNANIKITYTPAYGGNKKGISKCMPRFIKQGIGDSYFDKNLYGNAIFQENDCWTLFKQNNGIYKFEDLNNKYIKPTYLHLKLP
ncbi:hypothetical protein K5688_001514 [Campylobacter lari]|nr:hypothetical protein [Campylobacter lari]